MARDKKTKCPKCLPGWLVQFGDLMSLLLTFFILLLSMAVMDKKTIEEYFDIMKRSMGFVTDATEAIKKDKKDPVEESDDFNTEESINEVVYNKNIQDVTEAVKSINSQSESTDLKITLEKGRNEFILDIPSSLMFKSGKYKISNIKSKDFIKKIAKIVRTMTETFNIEVIGFAGAHEVEESNFKGDSWDLSALRAVSVVNELVKNKIRPASIKVSSYGAYHPKSDIPAENRRVEIRFFGDAAQTSVLDEENFFDRLK